MDPLSFPVVDAIKAAGSNPLALAAFALLLAAMMVVALKVRRNKNLLQNLEKLPEKDRLAALKLEMATLKIKGELSPEQWLRHNSRQYLLGGLIVLCLTLVVLVSVVLPARPEKAQPSGVHIELLPEPAAPAPATPASASAHGSAADKAAPDWLLHRVAQTASALAVGNERALPQMAEQGIPEERTVSYQALIERGVSRITYASSYFDLVAAGGPVEGFNLLGVPFRWQFPRLSATVANNTGGVMVLSAARIEVLEAEPLNEVIPLLEDLSVERLVFRNEGWGEVIAPRVEFSIGELPRPGEISLFAPKTVVVDMPGFGETGELPLTAHLPEALKNRSAVQVQGWLEYGAPAARKKLRFKTRVSLQVRSAVGMPPSYTYDLMLKAGQAKVTRQLGLAQQIKPGDSDHFALRVGSDRSARYRLRIDFVTAGGQVMKGSEVLMDIFVPRTAARLALVQGAPK
jgi:hypothetical protein